MQSGAGPQPCGLRFDRRNGRGAMACHADSHQHRNERGQDETRYEVRYRLAPLRSTRREIMILDKQQVKERYAKIAPSYGVAHVAYKVLGIERRRRELVAMLALNDGDTVLDLGCGTGINFAPLRAAVGSSGRIIAVDISGAMLARAQSRVEKNGWSNVELREGDLFHGGAAPKSSGSNRDLRFGDGPRICRSPGPHRTNCSERPEDCSNGRKGTCIVARVGD